MRDKIPGEHDPDWDDWQGTATFMVYYRVILPGIAALVVAVATCIQIDAKEDTVNVAVPEADKQREALKTVKELFRADYAKSDRDDQIVLAKKLFNLALGTRDDLAAHYVLLVETRDIAVRAFDAFTAVAAIDRLARQFAVDPIDLKLRALDAVCRGARTPDSSKSAAECSLSTCEEALAADKFDAATKLTALADASARNAQDMPLLLRAKSQAQEIRELQAEAKGLLAARKKLQGNPEEPEANLTVGRYLCLVRSDWENGLQLLAKGSDPRLKDIAAVELQKPAQAESQFSLGDEWWAVAEKASGRLRSQAYARACKWYRTARPNLEGLRRAKVDSRLKTVAASRLDGRTPMQRFLEFLKCARAVSAGTASGQNIARIQVNSEVLLDGSPRGISAVAILEEEVVLRKTFDTHKYPEDSAAFATEIKKLQPGTMVVLAVSDEATSSFSSEAQAAIFSIGGKTGLFMQTYRCSYICIGMKGLEKGQAVEKLGLEALVYPP